MSILVKACHLSFFSSFKHQKSLFGFVPFFFFFKNSYNWCSSRSKIYLLVCLFWLLMRSLNMCLQIARQSAWVVWIGGGGGRLDHSYHYCVFKRATIYAPNLMACIGSYLRCMWNHRNSVMSLVQGWMCNGLQIVTSDQHECFKYT